MKRTFTLEEATWTCATCGIIAPTMLSTGHYLRRPCPCQDAAREAQREAEQEKQHQTYLIGITYEWLGKAWSDAMLANKTFENFQKERQAEAYTVAQLFAQEPDGTLILHGSYGTGKTHLLAAICNALRTRKKESRFVTAPTLFKAIQEAMHYHEDHNLIIRKAITTPLLVLDDIDKARPSEFRLETLYDVIDGRTKRGLPIALSTNKLSELEQYVGGAVCSRLQIGQLVIEMKGHDFRKGL